jgi:hypothetical protein
MIFYQVLPPFEPIELMVLMGKSSIKWGIKCDIPICIAINTTFFWWGVSIFDHQAVTRQGVISRVVFSP